MGGAGNDYLGGNPSGSEFYSDDGQDRLFGGLGDNVINDPSLIRGNGAETIVGLLHTVWAIVAATSAR